MTAKKDTRTFRQRLADRWKNDREDNSPVPCAVPLTAQKPLSLQEEIQRFIRNEVSQIAESQQHESFEEADDFEPEDENITPLTQYELTALQADAPMHDADPPEAPQESGTATQEGATAPSEAPAAIVPSEASQTAPADHGNGAQAPALNP